ncbi:unnamed protein product, partial [Durusdinium trenchii]
MSFIMYLRFSRCSAAVPLCCAAEDGTFGTYDAMFFMELDAEPVRSNWLMQFISEAYDPFTAIRG